MKNYFLLFSRHPIFYNVVLWLMGFLIVAYLSDVRGELTIEQRNIFVFGITIILIVNIILIYHVIKRNILRSPVYLDDDNLFYGALTKGGQRLILEKPVWGKGRRYAISRSGFSFSKMEINIYSFYNFELSDIVVKIPYRITLFLSSNFKSKESKLELFDELLKYPDSFRLNFGYYLEKLFEKINRGNKKFIELELIKYSNKEITEIGLMKRIYDLIKFPERVFSNVKGTRLIIQKPEYSFCKGFGCSKEEI